MNYVTALTLCHRYSNLQDIINWSVYMQAIKSSNTDIVKNFANIKLNCFWKKFFMSSP